MDIGASVKISSVKLPENAKVTITDRDFVVAFIAPPTIVKEPEKPAEETALKELKVRQLQQQKVVKQHQLKKVMLLKKMTKIKSKALTKNLLLIKKHQKRKKKIIFMLLLVGLGNPGPNNSNNRHNIGFKIIDAINQQFNLSKQKPKFKGLLTT